jgi:hypothetical protein
VSIFSVLVAHATNFNIVTGVPGPVNIEQTGLLGFIQNGYLLALGLAGLLAVGSITYGAIEYTLSRGNAAKLSDAWDRIIQALIGILLLVGAGTILTVINPGLLSLELPQLQQVESTPFSADTFTGSIPEEVEDKIDSTSGKVTNVDKVAPTVSCKTDPTKCKNLGDLGFTCGVSKDRCVAHEQVAAALTCAAQQLGISNSDIRISEGYPPNGSHISSGHNNGCIVDTTLSAKYQKGGCAAIKAFTDAVNSSACGGYALNEYANVKGKDSADRFSGGYYEGCGVKPINKKTGKPSWGGNNVHVRGCPNGTLP